MSYCILENPLFFDKELYNSFLEVKTRILEIHQTHIEKEISEKSIIFQNAPKIIQQHLNKISNLDDLEWSIPNITILLQNRWGGKMKIGISKDGWLLIVENPGEFLQVSYSENLTDESVVFLLPKRTQFKPYDLVSREIAERSIENWLDTGEIKEQEIFQSSYCILIDFVTLEENEDMLPTTLERYDTFSEVEQRILEIAEEHIAQQYNSQCIDEDLSNKTVFLRNRWGGKMQVGVSKDGWLLIVENPGESSQVSYSENSTDELVVFLLPEWTEFYSCNLISRKNAKKNIENWLEMGQLITPENFQY